MLSTLDWEREGLLTGEVLRRLLEMTKAERLGVTELWLQGNGLEAVPDELPSLLPHLRV